MKPILFLTLIALLLSGCKQNSTHNSITTAIVENQPIIIDTIEVLKKELVLNGNKGKWYYGDKPFNGYSLKLHKNGVLEEKRGYYNGKREGVARSWSKDKKLQLESYYKNNRLSGVYKTWWPNGTLSSQSYYKNGLMQGVEKQWFSDGKLSKVRNLVDGKEHGIQKAWLANGKLYVNYEAKNGRIFGMRRANSCYRLEDEVIIKKKKI